MIKILFYLPIHLLNLWIAHLAPRRIFKAMYAPSSETIREQEQTIRNNTRLNAYRAKKYLQ